jgi:hypothetical protein
MNPLLLSAGIIFFGGGSRAWAQETGSAAANPSPPGAVPGASPTPMTDIHDIKPLLPMGADLPMWVWAAGALMLILVILCAWWWFRRRKAGHGATLPTPVVAPHVEALVQLDALAADISIDGKVFYFRLSAIVRHYLERRFDIPAAEMTTEELLPAVDRLRLPLDVGQSFKAFCRAADPIKFAGVAVNREHMAQDLAFARNLVTCTAAPARDPEPEADQQGPETAAPKHVALTGGTSETVESSTMKRSP